MDGVNDRWHRRRYFVLALVLGLPTLAAGGTLAVMAVTVFFSRNRYLGSSESLLLLVWGLAGILGLLGWLWLSGVYLRQGRAGLRRTGPIAWVAIALGALAALGVVGFIVFALAHGSPWQVLGYLILGPPLLLPSAHLAWLRGAGALADNG